MCGISGFFGYSGSGALDAQLLDAMNRLLAHRGPDGDGAWLCLEDRIGLANRRLEIVEPGPRGAQPMANRDGSLRLTFNGEIYNHRLLRSDLESRGHVFRSHSDTEAILHAYEEWGLDCFRHLIGMWGLALWDSTRKRLVLSRDRLGIKPLYYVLRSGELRFASEIKSLFVEHAVPAELDLEAFSLYLTHLSAPEPRTLFRDVRKLPAGHFLVAERGHEPRLESFWDPLCADNPLVQRAAAIDPAQIEAFAVDCVRELLQRSVERRLMSDVPVGLFLSGGVDSSTIAALMRQLSTGQLRAFSVGYSEPGYVEELPHSRRVAELFGFESHEVILNEQDVIDCVDEVLYHLDEPNADWANFPIFHLAREARRARTPVILQGDGSDEIFGGYEGYLRAIGMARLAASPLWKVPLVKLLPRFLEPLFLAAEQIGRGRGLRDELDRMAVGAPPFIGLQVSLTERLKRRVLAADRRDGMSGLTPSTVVSHHIARARNLDSPIVWPSASSDGRYDSLRWISYLELKQRLPGLLLTRLDRMTMAHGVEARVPFLDHELVEFVMALPGALRLRGGVAKHLLKRAVEQWLPADVVYRPKVPFGAPIATWLRGRLGQHVEEQVRQSRMVREDILRWDAIRELILVHRAGRVDYGQAIWSLYTACRWYDIVFASIDGKSQNWPAGFATCAGPGS
jgi:asparagine synthase (glutamine-hydrolysing)